MSVYHQPHALKWTLTLILLWIKRKKTCCLKTKHPSPATPQLPLQHRPRCNPDYAFHQNKLLISRNGCGVFVFVCGRRTAESLCFHRPVAILLALGPGTNISAVVEIHQAWQVYCTTTLHRPWPTAHAKISLSIRKTFMKVDWKWFPPIGERFSSSAGISTIFFSCFQESFSLKHTCLCCL